LRTVLSGFENKHAERGPERDKHAYKALKKAQLPVFAMIHDSAAGSIYAKHSALPGTKGEILAANAKQSGTLCGAPWMAR